MNGLQDFLVREIVEKKDFEDFMRFETYISAIKNKKVKYHIEQLFPWLTVESVESIQWENNKIKTVNFWIDNLFNVAKSFKMILHLHDDKFQWTLLCHGVLTCNGEYDGNEDSDQYFINISQQRALHMLTIDQCKSFGISFGNALFRLIDKKNVQIDKTYGSMETCVEWFYKIIIYLNQ